MSMISAQCDELRERAKELRNLAPDPDVPYLVPSTKEIMALAMRSAAGEMEDAADTIWELRNKCADLVDERERLFRANVEKNNKILRLVAENAKLRDELAKARDPQRIGGQADPSSFVYAIEQLREFRWQHATNDDDAIPYINNVVAAHERENAKLREECNHWHVEQVHAYGNWEDAYKRAIELEKQNAKLRELLDYMTPIAWYAASEQEREHMRELGLEVDG